MCSILNILYLSLFVRNPLRHIIFFSLILGHGIFLSAQCTTGQEPECMCATADTLCSIVDLNGYMNGLDDFQHPDDGPQAFCGRRTETNNPNWFAFIAWCESIEIEVELDDCGSIGRTEGGQIAVYTDCTFQDQVDCESECRGEEDLRVRLRNLIIGKVYHVMIDGCSGVTCDYELEVSPLDCKEELGEWVEPFPGDSVLCIGADEFYEVEDILAAFDYHWFIDGQLQSRTADPEFGKLWDVPGVYELCVDVSNPCIDVSEAPAANCKRIAIGDPDPGNISNDGPYCPRSISDIVITEYQDTVAFDLAIVIVDANDIVIGIHENIDSLEFITSNCGSFIVYSLSYNPTEGVVLPQAGMTYTGTDCSIFCCRETSEIIVFEDNDRPNFQDPPQNISYECLNELETAEELIVQDNCIGDRNIIPDEVGTVDLCNGGPIIRRWSSTDYCGNEEIHEQTVTIEPWPRLAFVDPPMDATISYDEYLVLQIPRLFYTNNATSNCAMEGFSDPVVTSDVTACGGEVKVEYELMDPCVGVVTHTHVLTVEENSTQSEFVVSNCALNATGYINYEKDFLDSLITRGVIVSDIEYYRTQDDLNNGVNPISFPYTNDDEWFQELYADADFGSNCSKVIRIALSIDPLPEIEVIATNETCQGMGDGTINIRVDANGLPFTLISESDTLMDMMISNLQPGDYSFSVIDSLNCKSVESQTIEEGLELFLVKIDTICNDNATPSLIDDDYYQLQLQIDNNKGNNGSYDLFLSQQPLLLGNSYGTEVLMELSTNDDPRVLQVIDVDSDCDLFIDIEPLLSCSPLCEMNLENFIFDCDDNNTPYDPEDDFYVVEFLISALNGGTSYEVLADGDFVDMYTYGEDHQIELAINNPNVNLQFVDNADSDCSVGLVLDDLIACSDSCIIEPMVVSVECQEDDVYSVELIVSGVNVTDSLYILPLDRTGYYGEPIVINNLPTSQADQEWVIYDQINPNCFAEVSLEFSLPFFDLEGIKDLSCNEKEICVRLVQSGTFNIEISWSGTEGVALLENELELCIVEPAIYSVSVVDLSTGCSTSQEFEITSIPEPNGELPDTIYLTSGETYQLVPSLDLGLSTIEEITWLTQADLSCYNCQDPVIQGYTDQDEVILEIITSDSCRLSLRTIIIDVTIPPTRIYIPNVLDPSLNELFMIFNNETIDLIDELSIYDRWGSQVFVQESFIPNDLAKAWDGQVDGKLGEEGVYVYHIVYTEAGRRENLVGTVTLLR